MYEQEKLGEARYFFSRMVRSIHRDNAMIMELFAKVERNG